MHLVPRTLLLGLLAGTAWAQLSSYESFLDVVSEWPPGPGAPLVPQQPDSELTAMMAEIDPARIKAIITKLVSFGTPDPLRGIGAARDWIASEMRTFAATSGGRMTVTVPMSRATLQEPSGNIIQPTVISNVVATLKGSTDLNRIYVVSGHYDSRVSNVTNFVDDATRCRGTEPYPDDDASGVAVSMELARVMASHRPAATIMFVAVAGEEQGLFGSTFLAGTLAI
ncbi:hypothetical protein B0H15DRAFT_1003665 [Mycena belliarum]|uniref:Peptide hydrolase n=1 Tax=Mycena belliarum TaxID=1033014 RepID=A0AAD6TS54_9AGAR|nr:hypothetical protein B0H15DRAFT_1003665 [Mycena belliae]